MGKNEILNYTINNTINIFLLISYLVMCAGFGTFFNQEFGIPNIYGTLIVVILSLIVFKKSLEGIEKVNLLLIPAIIIAILFLTFKTGNRNFTELLTPSNTGWLLSSILYASYNSIILIPIIITLSKNLHKKNDVIFVILGVFIILVSISFLIFILIQKNLNEVIDIQMPVIYLASQMGIKYKIIYSLVVLSAIFTTAISSGYSLLYNITNNKKQYVFLSCIISGMAIILSPIGFGNLLELLYPVLGYIGLIQIILIIVQNKNSK